MLLRENGVINSDGKAEHELILCSSYDQFNLLSSGSISSSSIITIKFQPNSVFYYMDDTGNFHDKQECIEKLKTVAFIVISNDYKTNGATYAVRTIEVDESYVIFSVDVYIKV